MMQTLVAKCGSCEAIIFKCPKCDNWHHIVKKEIRGPDLLLTSDDGSELSIPVATITKEQEWLLA